MCSFQDLRDGGVSAFLVYHASATLFRIPTKIEVAFVSPIFAPGVPDDPETTSVLVKSITNDYNGVVYFVAAIGGRDNTFFIRLLL